MTFSQLQKTAILTGCFLSYFSIAIAQFSGGGKIGANIANLHGSSVVNSSAIVGLNLGGFVNYDLKEHLYSDFGERLSVQVELVIEGKGAKSDYTFYNMKDTTKQTYTTQNIKQSFTYVTIPLFAKYTTEEKDDFSFYGEAGLYISGLFGLKFDGEVSRDNDGNPKSEERKYRDDYSGFDFGVAAGGGVNYRLPFGGRKQPFTGFASLRYSLGLYNIGQIKAKTNDIPEFMLDNVKTNTLSFGVGISYLIPFEKK